MYKIPERTTLLKIISFIFLLSLLISCESHASGHVFDTKTEEPIVYAKVKSEENFDYTGDMGEFYVEYTDYIFMEEKITVSKRGYKTATLNAEVGMKFYLEKENTEWKGD